MKYNEIEFLNTYFSHESIKKFKQQIILNSLKELKHDKESFIKIKNECIKQNGGENLMSTAINTFIKDINKEIKTREYKSIYRSMALAETERTNNKVLESRIKNDSEIGKLVDQYKKQLGELGYQYGFLINRIEKYFRNLKVEESDNNFIIRDTWKNFMNDFHKRDRSSIMEALTNDKYSKITLYRKDDDGNTLYEEHPFIMGYTAGKMNERLNNLQNIKNFDELKLPIVIVLVVNKQIFTCIHKASQGLKLGKTESGEKRRECIKSIVDLPIMLKENLNGIQENLQIKKDFKDHNKHQKQIAMCFKNLRYSDKIRILAEKIIEIYERGKATRIKLYFDLELNDIMLMCFPGYKKNEETYIRIETMLLLITYTLSKIMPIKEPKFLRKEKKIRILIND